MINTLETLFKRWDRIFVITIFVDLEGLFSVQNFRTDWTRVWEEIWEMLRLHVHHDTVFGSVRELITQSTWKPHSFILGHKLLKVLRFSDIWEIDKLGWHGKVFILEWMLKHPCEWFWRGACGRWRCPGLPHSTDTGNWMCGGNVWTRHARGCHASLT